MLFHRLQHFSSKQIEPMGNHLCGEEKIQCITEKIDFKIELPTLTLLTSKKRSVPRFLAFRMLHSTMIWISGMVPSQRYFSPEISPSRFCIWCEELQIMRKKYVENWKNTSLNFDLSFYYVQAKSTVAILLITVRTDCIPQWKRESVWSGISN